MRHPPCPYVYLGNTMQLSVVSTLYCSAPHLLKFIERTIAVVGSVSSSFELILVNDGSPDDSLILALSAQKSEPRIKILDLSRNFGHHAAGLTGLAHAQGEFVFLIDSDLEDPPEIFLQFWKYLTENPTLDVVYGLQTARKGGAFRRLSGSVFYSVFNLVSEVKITPSVLTVRLMRKAYVTALDQYQERDLFAVGIMTHAGFNQEGLVVEKKFKPTTTYSLRKQVSLCLSGIFSFSSKPFLFLLILGGALSASALFTSAWLAASHVFFNAALSFGIIVVVSSLFVSGAVFLCTGLLGLLLTSIRSEVKQRPRAIIKTIY